LAIGLADKIVGVRMTDSAELTGVVDRFIADLETSSQDA